jgi:hypothetical protein
VGQFGLLPWLGSRPNSANASLILIRSHVGTAATRTVIGQLAWSDSARLVPVAHDRQRTGPVDPSGKIRFRKVIAGIGLIGTGFRLSGAGRGLSDSWVEAAPSSNWGPPQELFCCRAAVVDAGGSLRAWSEKRIVLDESEDQCAEPAGRGERGPARQRHCNIGSGRVSSGAPQNGDELPSGHELNAICPYFTMFPLEFPLQILRRHSKQRERVLDPFCGRGTTNFAARLTGLYSVGIDISPVAQAITAAKLMSTSAEAIEKELARISQTTFARRHLRSRFVF